MEPQALKRATTNGSSVSARIPTNAERVAEARRRRAQAASEQQDPEKAAIRAFVAAFGRALRRVRRGRGWTQREVAEKAHLSSNFVARLERGEVSPSLYVATRISSALGVELADLLGPQRGGPPLGTTRHMRSGP